MIRLSHISGRRWLVAAVALGGGCGGGDRLPTTPPVTPPTIVAINGATVTVAIAATQAARTQGLMGVTRLAPDSGMLFVFADDRQRAFWMKDTPIPLSIVFLDASRKVVFMADMPPNTTTLFGGFNAPPMRYALEVNQGWFVAHGVTLGMTATFTLPAATVPEPDP